MDTNENINHQALTEALLDEEGLIPDIDAEWERLSQRHQTDRQTHHRTYLRGLVSGIAATVVLVVAVALMWPRGVQTSGPLVAYTALPTSGEVMWQSGEHPMVSLSNETDEVGSHAILTHRGDSLAVDFVAAGIESAQQQAVAEMQVITTPPGCSVNVTLPDSSVVWLNGNSRLSFPSFFADDCRRISLDGEAYIKAAHDAEHPLYIETEQLTTRVLGTEFYVSSMAGTAPSVSLVEGRVEVTASQSGCSEILEPGQSVTLNKTSGTFQRADIDVMKYICMRDGYFYFDDVRLSEMMTELGRWYNVNVVFEDEELLDLKMRYFCRRHDTVEESVALLNNLRRIHAKVVDGTIFIK